MDSRNVVYYANRPSLFFLGFLIIIASVGTLSLPFMLWLTLNAFHQSDWTLTVAALLSALIAAGMTMSWWAVRSTVRQRRDGSLHSITINSREFIYRNDDLVCEIPLENILSVENRVDPSGGSLTWSAEIAYRKPDGSRTLLWISSVLFSEVWVKNGSFSQILSDAITANRNDS